MTRRPPRSTRTDTLFPYTTLFRSRLNNHARAVAIRGLDRAILHLLQQAGRLDHIDYQTTRLKAIEADQFLRNTAALDHLGISVQHVQHVSWLESSALADFKVVEVVTRRDLHRARTKFQIGRAPV